MQLPFSKISSTKKLENAILVLLLLFVFKLIFPSAQTVVNSGLSALVVFAAIYFSGLYLSSYIKTKVDNPLAIIINIGILSSLLFFIISLTSSIFSEADAVLALNNIFTQVITQITITVIVVSTTAIFLSFKELLFLKHKKSPAQYFRTMVIFIALACLSSFLDTLFDGYDYLVNTFQVLAIILISVNSIRVSWIAFLIKKQKIFLLVLSIVLSILFVINAILLFSQFNFITKSVELFLPGLQSFLWLSMLYGSIYFGVIFFTTLFHLPTAEAFDRKSEELSSLLDLSNLITQVFDFKELAESVTDTTIRVCNSDAAWLVTESDGEFELVSQKNIGYVEAEKITDALLKDKAGELGAILTFSKDRIKFTHRTDTVSTSLSTYAVAPLKIHNKIIGYLFAARRDNIRFDEDDQKTITTYADYAAVTLENAKLIEQSIEKERLEKELDVAREIQHKIIPIKTPQLGQLTTSALFVPAFEVGGDYYDFFELPDNKLGFVIADVSGKGISAAFIMAEVKGIFESLSRTIGSPKKLLQEANFVLNKSLEKKSFVTAIYGVFDLTEGTLKFARCGHPPLVRINNGSLERITPTGIGLGLDRSSTFENNLKEIEIKLSDNDLIVVYTDGITEAKNEKFEDFGEEKLEQIIFENKNEEIDLISNKIMSAVSCYQRNNSQHDDITLVVFKWNNNTN